MGADAVIDVKSEDVVSRVLDLTGGVGVDGVLEMSGHPAAIDQAMKMVRPGGRVSLLGVPSGSQVSLDVGGDIVFRGVNVQGIAGRRMWQTWQQVSALLASGLDIGDVMTHRMPLEEYEEGMSLMASGECGKVVLIP
jgi:threonine 3-dehydrogenase